MNMKLDEIKKLIKTINDFPVKGIIFRDILDLFLEPSVLDEILERFAVQVKDKDFDLIISPEARGILFGLPLAIKLKKPFAIVRKKGKLPGEVDRVKCDIEYGSRELEISKSVFNERKKILIVDDLIATGGTTRAIQQLVEKNKAEVVAQLYLIELLGLTDHNLLKGEFFSLLQY